jgi:hypothetical protein
MVSPYEFSSARFVSIPHFQLAVGLIRVLLVEGCHGIDFLV